MQGPTGYGYTAIFYGLKGAVMARAKEERAAYQKAYREANRDKVAAVKKARRDANRAWMKTWREANREAFAARRKAYRESNREVVADYIKAAPQAVVSRVHRKPRSRRAAAGGWHTVATET